MAAIRCPLQVDDGISLQPTAAWMIHIRRRDGVFSSPMCFTMSSWPLSNDSTGVAGPQIHRFQSLKGPGPNRSHCNAATWHGYFKAIGASLEDLELNDLERRDNAMPCGFWAMVNKISEYQYLDYVTYFSVFCGDWSKPLITILGNNHPSTGYVGVPVVLIARSIYIYIMYIFYDTAYYMEWSTMFTYIYIYIYTDTDLSMM